ncbi:MAG: ABC transporter ATP-binding protein [Alphaproteobacteria bacterium]|nr:ABC transporter ATP-binding protein [Alphaproteobacteria bacterium]
MTGPVLAAQGLGAGYGRKAVLRGIDLELGEREVLLILGHNGAGKTTLVRSLFGLVPVKAGKILHRGVEVTGRSPADHVRAGIAFVPQGHGVFPTLTVSSNLDLGAFSMDDPSGVDKARAEVLSLFPILAERRDQLAGTLSGGQQQMLAIGMALMHRPEILILDEPSIGLAPNLVGKVMEAIQDINRRLGVTILMVEQNVKYGLPIANRVIVLKTGAKVYDGAPAPLADHVELVKYF